VLQSKKKMLIMTLQRVLMLVVTNAQFQAELKSGTKVASTIPHHNSTPWRVYCYSGQTY